MESSEQESSNMLTDSDIQHLSKALPEKLSQKNEMDTSLQGSNSTDSIPSGSTASLPSVITANVRRQTPDSSGTSTSSGHNVPSPLQEGNISCAVKQSTMKDTNEEIDIPVVLESSSISAPISVPRPSRVITGFDSPNMCVSITAVSPQQHKRGDSTGKSDVQNAQGEQEPQVLETDALGISPGKTTFGSLLAQRISGMISRQADVQKPQTETRRSHQSPQKAVNVQKVITGSKTGTSPLSQKSLASTISQTSNLAYQISTQVSNESASIANSVGSTKGSHQSKKSKNMKLPIKVDATQHHTMSECDRVEQSPTSIRSLFGSITVWSSRPILSRHLSQGGGSSMMVNYVTEAQSVLPSLTSAFSIDHLETMLNLDPVELAIFDIDNNQRSMSHQDQLDVLNILEENDYIDTVKSTDSAASLLRRSMSVPPEYHYKPQKLHIQDIFNEIKFSKKSSDPVTGKVTEKTIPAHLDQDDKAWRQIMDDLLEQPEYLDSVESACSRTGLLASQARALAQQYGTKPILEEPSLSRQSDKSVSTKQLKFIYFKNLIVLSLGFMFIFMSYMSLRNLQSSLYKTGGLGIIALSCVYASLFLGCVFATTIVQKLRPKNTILICISGMFLYVLANFYPSYYTLVPACVLTGFCLANIWTAHATYLANVAARYAVLVDDKIQNILSQFNGIFFAFFQTSQIIGGLISSTVLSPSKQIPGIHWQNSTNMSDTEVISIMIDNKSVDVYVTYTPQCGVKYCSYYEDNLSNTDPSSAVDKNMIYILVGVYAGCMIAGLLVIALCLDPLDGVMKKSQTCLSKQLTAVFKFFTQWKVVCLIGLMFYTMLQSSFMFGEFTKAFVTCNSGVYLVGYTMVCLSSMSALSSFLSGRMQRYIGRQALFCSAFAIHITLIIVEIVWMPGPEHTVIIFIIAACWGLADGMLLTQTISLFGILFADNKEPAFAGLKMCQAFGSTILFASSEYVCTIVKLVILLVFAVLALLGLQVLEFKLRKEKQSKKVLDCEPTSV